MDHYKEYQIAQFINRAPITTPIPDLIEQIVTEFGVKLDYGSVYRYRKRCPAMKIAELKAEQGEVLSNLAVCDR
jgi:hypothetical protein